MTREELKAHCERQIQQFEQVEKIMPVTPNDWKRYEEHKLILELLEQETVSKETYDHEYFLRKKMEAEIDHLRRYISKLETQITLEQEPFINKPCLSEKVCEHDKQMVLDEIRAEIDGIEINGQVDEHTSFIRTGEQVKQLALNIIDKYKADKE